jgi:nitroreductase
MSVVDFSSRTPSSLADNLFVQRWSPRSFEYYEIQDSQLKKIIDAARWSPSCSNEQPWNFYTAKSASSFFAEFVGFLSEGNQVWAKNSSVLGFITSKNFFEKKEKVNTLASFDCGAAWMSLSLQASLEGLHTHGMGGINREKVSNFLKIDSTKESVLMGFAIGKLADKQKLEQALQQREIPSNRKNLNSIWTSF